MLRWIKTLLLPVLLLSVIPLAAAQAEDPPLLEWTTLLPGLAPAFDANDSNVCTSGKEQCVHAVIKEMTRRFDSLGCDHDAAFALAYLRTTEEYHRFWHEGQFAEPEWLNHYDAVFASLYFEAIDDWHNGRKGEVPPAWKTAFDATDKRSVSGYGSLFLGMNAHINRDLPFVIASIGMTKADGTTRKADHDKVNQFLNRIQDDLIPELAGRIDPTIDDTSIAQTTLDDFASFQVIPAWREMAWRNAEALVNAPNAAARALVAQGIEAYANTVAATIKAATSYGFLSPNGANANARDAYCAAHYGD